MASAQFDIFKKDESQLIWIESVHDLASAKRRIEELATKHRGEYVVYDQRSRRIVAAFGFE
jgi:hypothetical protein